MMKWHVLAVQNVPLHQQAGRNQDIADYVSDIVRSHPRMGAGENETSQNHDDILEHLRSGASSAESAHGDNAAQRQVA